MEDFELLVPLDSLPLAQYQPLELSKLYPFQLKAVRWMLEREGVQIDSNNELLASQIPVFPPIPRQLPGGLLCDEMGLGKTLMMLSIIVLHKHSLVDTTTLKLENGKPLINCTLIVVPSTIKSQWIEETAKNARSLKWAIYDGSQVDFDGLDVIFTSYQCLIKEIHSAKPGRDGARRGNRKVLRKFSPLVDYLWWRVVLDECQLVQSAKNCSKACEMSCLIPRVNSWGISGTPFYKTGLVNDLNALFNFFAGGTLGRLERKLTYVPEELKIVMHRNRKNNVLFDLPPQIQHTLYLKQSMLESQLYNDLLKSSLENIGPEIIIPTFPTTGVLTYLEQKILDDKFLDYERAVSARNVRMGQCFLTLRQSCCHNSVTLQRGASQSVFEVLNGLVKESKAVLSGLDRTLILNRIEVGLVHDSFKDFENALKVYSSLLHPVESASNIAAINRQHIEQDQRDYIAEDEREINKRLWREIQHKLYFLIGSTNHSLKDTEEEERYYTKAETLRSAMLADYEREFEHQKAVTLSIYNKNSLILEEKGMYEVEEYGGIKVSRIIKSLRSLESLLAEQFKFIVEFRDILCKTLMSSLNGRDDGGVEGEEYDWGIRVQEKATIYQEVLSNLLSYRKNTLIPSGSIHTLLQTTSTQHFETQHLKWDGDSTYQSIVNLLKATSKSQDIPVQERNLAKMAFDDAHSILSDQLEQLKVLEGESMNGIFNARIKYYTHLSRISDTLVARTYSDTLEGNLTRLRLVQESTLLKERETLGRKRYFEYMIKHQVEEVCSICAERYDEGVLTQCGHSCCRSCSLLWLKRKGSCHTCKARVVYEDLFAITKNSISNKVTPVANSADGNELLKELSHIQLDLSYGTKIDTLMRHIKKLRGERVKVLIFSQWVLDTIMAAFRANGIGYISLEGDCYDPAGKRSKKSKDSAVNFFLTNPSLTCILLNAKSQAAGLTLTIATHVFLIEPMTRKGLTDQAIARVHRIGQTNETHVYNYLMGDVESYLNKVSNESDKVLVEGGQEGVSIECLRGYFFKDELI